MLKKCLLKLGDSMRTKLLVSKMLIPKVLVSKMKDRCSQRSVGLPRCEDICKVLRIACSA